MFKKIVSRLPFSPSLINELGSYAKRLRKEENARKTGLVLTALALVVQSLVVFSPPESANAANSSDLVYGGLHTKQQVNAACKNNRDGFRDLLAHAGISCKDMSNAKLSQINTRSGGKDLGWKSWNRKARFGMQRGERRVDIAGQEVYVRPLAAFDTGRNTTGSGSWYKAFVGKTSTGKDFALMTGCANIVLKEYPKSDKNIKVCDIRTKKIVTIRESQFSTARHTKNLDACKPKPQPKKITVCELSTLKMVTISENEFNSSRHSKNPDDCKPKPQPAANCSSLGVKRIDRTNFEFTASSSTVNGATVSSYIFVIKDKDGKEIERKTVNSNRTTASIKYNQETEGSYTVQAIVNTSVGQKTADACVEEFVVQPIERCPLNPNLPINDPDCQPCTGDPNLWVKDEDCKAQIVKSKSATNLTTKKDATLEVAKASERIEYTITAKNEGKADATVDLKDDISDVLEYANLYDNGGGTFDEKEGFLTWPQVTLKPGESQSRTYVVQMPNQISPRAQGTSDPSSSDCRMTNHFGNTLDVYVDCPAPKAVEQVVKELPQTGATENMIFGGIIAAVATFFYFRSRQLGREVRLVRREVTAGTI